MPPRYFKDCFYFLLVAILFLGKKQVSMFHFLKSRLLVEIEPTLKVHQELGSLLVEIRPTPRVHQGSGGEWAYTKSPPRLLVDIWWTFFLSTKKIASANFWPGPSQFSDGGIGFSCWDKSQRQNNIASVRSWLVHVWHIASISWKQVLN